MRRRDLDKITMDSRDNVAQLRVELDALKREVEKHDRLIDDVRAWVEHMTRLWDRLMVAVKFKRGWLVGRTPDADDDGVKLHIMIEHLPRERDR